MFKEESYHIKVTLEDIVKSEFQKEFLEECVRRSKQVTFVVCRKRVGEELTRYRPVMSFIVSSISYGTLWQKVSYLQWQVEFGTEFPTNPSE